MAKPFPIRTALSCSNLWKIEAEEKDQLTRFFLLFDSGESLFKDLEKRENPQYPYQSDYFLKLEGDNAIWNVRFLKPIEYLKKLGEQKIALSFRENKDANFHWVVVTEWKEKAYEEVHPKETTDG